MTQQVPEYGYNIQLYIDPISSYIQGRLYLAICWGYIQLYVRPIYSQIQGELYIARYRVYIQLDIRVGYIQLDIGSIYSQIQRKYVFVFFSTGSPLRMGAPQQKLFVITNSIQQQQRNGETATPFSGRLYRNPRYPDRFEDGRNTGAPQRTLSVAPNPALSQKEREERKRKKCEWTADWGSV